VCAEAAYSGVAPPLIWSTSAPFSSRSRARSTWPFFFLFFYGAMERRGTAVVCGLVDAGTVVEQEPYNIEAPPLTREKKWRTTIAIG